MVIIGIIASAVTYLVVGAILSGLILRFGSSDRCLDQSDRWVAGVVTLLWPLSFIAGLFYFTSRGLWLLTQEVSGKEGTK